MTRVPRIPVYSQRSPKRTSFPRLVDSKAATQERDDYRRFVLALADKVATAHREGGQSVSPAEAEAIQQITAALGPAGS